MGASSRPVFEFDDPNLADEFLVEWFEKWRLQMGGFTDFILAGHSFGGYIGGLYALKYPENIKKLLMMSPLGINKVPDGFDLMKEMEKYPEKHRPSRTFFTIAEIIWNTLQSPFDIIRKTGPYFSDRILGGYVRARMKSLNEHE